MSNRRRKLPKPTSPRKAEKNKWRTRTFSAISGAVVLIGFIAAAVTLLPRVTVTVSDPVDANNPFSSSVTITNTGYIPLNSVRAGICFDVIQISRPAGSKPPQTTLLGDCRKQSIFLDTLVPHDLGLDDRFTFSISDFFGNPVEHQSGLESAKISIVVPYRLPLLYFERQKRFPLFAKRQSNGNFYWYADAPLTN